MKPHGIERKEWERRFGARIAEKAVLTSEELSRCVDAELESYPASEDDWLTEPPEDAADMNLSYWTDDE